MWACLWQDYSLQSLRLLVFDMNQSRVDALMAGHDATLEVSDELLQTALKNGFVCTTNLENIKDCNFMLLLYQRQLT